MCCEPGDGKQGDVDGRVLTAAGDERVRRAPGDPAARFAAETARAYKLLMETYDLTQEELAQMRDGLPPLPLYRVRFRQKDVWPDYHGNPADVLEVEIFQHWLEKA